MGEQPTAAPPPSDDQDADRSGRKEWWRRKAFAVPVGLVGGLVLLAVVGAALGDGGRDRAAELEAELATVEGERAELESQLQELEAQVEDAEEHAQQAEERARDDLEAELDERREELESRVEQDVADRAAELEERAEELDARAAGLDEREADLADREERLQRILQNEFGDGTWEVGVDIEPGRYRTDPGDGCYWARLRNRGGGTDSIIDNNNARGDQEIVEISGSDAYFESVRCGTWTPAD